MPTTPKPTGGATSIVPIALHMTGLTCAEYGAIEEAAVNDALLLTILGAKSFASHECADAASRRRRRLLQASSVTITTDATVRDAAYGDGTSKSDIADEAQSAVQEAAASGELGAAIVDAASALDPTSPLLGVELSTTLPPTPAPTRVDNNAWEVGSLSFLALNAVCIVGFSVYMKRTVGTSAITNGNIVAISLGWIDQVSDLLFGVELVAFTPEGGGFVQILGVLALVWFVGTAVYNYVMWQRIMKANQFDKALVGEHAELYGALSIFVLGSLDLMTIFPWTDPNVAHTHSYPSKDAVSASIRSALLEDVPQLLFNAAYFVAVDRVGIFPIVNGCVTVLTLLWTVFTKKMIFQSFDAFDATTSEAEGARREDPPETELAAATGIARREDPQETEPAAATGVEIEIAAPSDEATSRSL